ncbi:glucose-6-phosphate dehydrogenase [Rhodoplanes sp. TEM]|uniref:Glucose-6-phosphate 1-dehydrogenase n=1 Tax=Rhodoplanes tepidamans TaxID=200616 RepID=A0ABT5JBU0_RHOTP|nr:MULTISPECIES: glucose-6-phosphate dehydrogenase [Rhodoplanes]MDC7786952.1 glucose-6-phosphate dehydrogenase [Rhodoplanes tepidamans]MDC7985057.1 glucose-6-phosphate dehydrogenase [Rhodoplanes sp. TEM]MDQ0355351.1 glucose-6-phosphate 1-dehydrogenase [Rhodoplanes tepidamans]
MTAKNGARIVPPADPCCFVVFGASGDLTHRLLVPALYNLAATGLLPEAFSIVGVARGEMTTEAFCAGLRDALGKFATRKVEPDVVERLLACVTYVQGGPEDDASFDRLGERLRQIEARRGTRGNRLFYLATPPTAFAPIARALGRTGLAAEENGAWRRLIVEKPFGTDLASAQALNRELLAVFEEHQIFRIDHYLGKETVQNIMVMRFANGLFEPIWNRDHIDQVQITVAETLPVGRRGKFYDATGALRDMVPNHLFQLLSLVAMEPPSRFDARSVRGAKAAVLDEIKIDTAEEALRRSVRGQYLAGRVGREDIPDYRATPDVPPGSATETYVALGLTIDNWRWAGVPFFLRTGKALCARRSEIAIKFKQAPLSMFRHMPVEHLAENFLTVGIAPEEGIALQFNAKVPGPSVAIDGVDMTFRYKDHFEAAPSTGYETLIYDCMIGDAILFQRADGVEAGWRAVQPFLDAWAQAGSDGLAFYKAGTDGPEEAHQLIGDHGRRWRPICG